MDPHLAHLTPASPPLLSSPPFPGGSETNSAPGLIRLSPEGFSVEGWAAWEEVSTLLTVVTISQRDAFLGARPPHPLLTAATPDLPVTPSPPWRTLTLTQGLPLCSASARPTSLSTWAPQSLCLCSKLIISNPVKVYIPHSTSQLMAPTFTHSNPRSLPHLTQQQVQAAVPWTWPSSGTIQYLQILNFSISGSSQSSLIFPALSHPLLPFHTLLLQSSIFSQWATVR